VLGLCDIFTQSAGFWHGSHSYIKLPLHAVTAARPRAQALVATTPASIRCQDRVGGSWGGCRSRLAKELADGVVGGAQHSKESGVRCRGRRHEVGRASAGGVGQAGSVSAGGVGHAVTGQSRRGR